MLKRVLHSFQCCMEAKFSNNFFQLRSYFVGVPSTEPFEILQFCGF